VWRRHGIDPPADEHEHMLAALGAVADGRWGAGKWRVDAIRRQIPDHFHAHARRNWW
jgi:hypothetical protein